MERRRSSCQLIVVVACVGLAGCGGHTRVEPPAAAGTVGGSGQTARPAGSRNGSASNSARPATAAASRPLRKSAARRAPRVRDPCPPRSTGALSQTDRTPSAATPCFRAIVTALWRGVRSDSSRVALYAFFPLAAYEQVKAIGDPAADYRDRLIADYDLDLHFAHRLLGPDPQMARLLSVIVPRAHIRWVPPGACYNRLGYYEVPNSRLVYEDGRDVRSFGIASLISWRGIWYVVHLGAVTRSGYSGAVDDPSQGTRTFAPSLTC